MEYRIFDLLDCLADAGQDLKPRGGNADRVRERTLEKLHGTSTLSVPRRQLRPMRVLAAAAVAVALLCGTVFAAWKLGAFRFEDEFGPAGKALDSYAQTYESDDAGSISADYGYASWVKADIGDYKLTLLELTASNGTLRAVVDVSPKREGVPAYRDSSLTLAFADYETVSSLPREVGGWKDRVELSAKLTESLPADAALRFCLSGPDMEPTMASFRLNELDEAWQEMAASDRTHYATSAETQDYRFSLHSLTASSSVIYAVVDVEALTDYGREHLDVVPEFSVYNRSRQNSGTLLDARPVGQEEGVRRYLVGFLGSRPLNEAGDSISFELLELFEEGDLSGHPYYLFDVKLESLVPDAITLTEPEGAPTHGVNWQSVSVDAMGLNAEGLGKLHDDGTEPTVELVFRDGSRETVMDSAWQTGSPRTEHDAMLQHKSGSLIDGEWIAYESIIFGTPIDPAELETIIIDGQSFRVEP